MVWEDTATALGYRSQRGRDSGVDRRYYLRSHVIMLASRLLMICVKAKCVNSLILDRSLSGAFIDDGLDQTCRRLRFGAFNVTMWG